jgi:hypothetical protein
MTPRQKLVMAIAGGTVLLVLVGLGIWGAVAPDSYSQSGHGCVNVSVAGSTGGNIMHYCGNAAKQFCQSSPLLKGDGHLAVVSRQQCHIAGLLPSGAATPGAS